MTRARVVLLVLLAACALGGVWLFHNASLPRLRRGFIPWMERLGRWRDAVELTQSAMARGKALPGDPEGLPALRAWAWRDLQRIAYTSYRVERPSHKLSGQSEETYGRVAFTVGGFRSDGARLERSAVARVRLRTGPRGATARRVLTALEGIQPDRVESVPRFHDATRVCGLGSPRNNPPFALTNRLIAGIWPGSGAAVLDFDADGDEDLFVGDGVRSLLYENDGHGHFADVTREADLAGPDGQGLPATGVAAGDIDGDGLPDLVLTHAFGITRVFRNLGMRRFEEVTGISGVRTPTNTRSAAFADVDGDGDLDLFIAVTGDYYRQMPDPPFDAEDGRPNLLFVNDGRGRFRDASREWDLAGQSRWTLSGLFADYDDDSRPDLFVTNDFGLTNLYRNSSERRFVDVARKSGAEVRAYGMSAAWGDFDGDERLDLYTTSCDTQWSFLHDYPSLPIPLAGRLFLPVAVSWMTRMASGNTLLLQQADHTFRDATARSGAARAGWNWSVVAADLDNDGWLDLYGTNGMWGDGRKHDRELEFWWETLAYWDDYIAGKKTFDTQGVGVAGVERDRYFRNRGRDGALTRFEERAFLDGLDLETNGRAVIAFDANGDGALDLYIRSVEAPEALFLGSRKPGEHFLRLRLVGAPGKSPREGTGARVTASLPGGRTIVLETSNASGYLATGSPIAHLGLGGATRIEDLTVRWPSGRIQRIGPVEQVDRTLRVDEGGETASPR